MDLGDRPHPIERLLVSNLAEVQKSRVFQNLTTGHGLSEGRERPRLPIRTLGNSRRLWLESSLQLDWLWLNGRKLSIDQTFMKYGIFSSLTALTNQKSGFFTESSDNCSGHRSTE